MDKGRRAANPFRFVSCMELREILGKRAMDEQRLLEIIEEAPADSIYYHTHSYYLRHAYTQQSYSSDFAAWVALHAQDRVLGERLGILDPFGFRDIEQLRQEIVAIIEDHLSHLRTIPRYTTEEPFEFIRSYIIEAPLDVEAWTLREFRDAMAGVEAGALYYHACEARMRKRAPSVDFARWLSADEGLGMQDFGIQVERVGRLGLSLEGMRERLVALCDDELARS
ncbi:MAG: DUF5752 family protein [Nitrospiraceae bacterium]